jgi:hypothetical protein
MEGTVSMARATYNVELSPGMRATANAGHLLTHVDPRTTHLQRTPNPVGNTSDASAGHAWVENFQETKLTSVLGRQRKLPRSRRVGLMSRDASSGRDKGARRRPDSTSETWNEVRVSGWGRLKFLDSTCSTK